MPEPGIEPGWLRWESEVLTTTPPNSLDGVSYSSGSPIVKGKTFGEKFIPYLLHPIILILVAECLLLYSVSDVGRVKVISAFSASKFISSRKESLTQTFDSSTIKNIFFKLNT